MRKENVKSCRLKSDHTKERLLHCNIRERRSNLGNLFSFSVEKIIVHEVFHSVVSFSFAIQNPFLPKMLTEF